MNVNAKNILGNIGFLLLFFMSFVMISELEKHQKNRFEFYSKTMESKNRCCISLDDCDKNCLIENGKKIYREVTKTSLFLNFNLIFLSFLPIFMYYYNIQLLTRYMVFLPFLLLLIFIKKL